MKISEILEQALANLNNGESWTKRVLYRDKYGLAMDDIRTIRDGRPNIKSCCIIGAIEMVCFDNDVVFDVCRTPLPLYYIKQAIPVDSDKGVAFFNDEAESFTEVKQVLEKAILLAKLDEEKL